MHLPLQHLQIHGIKTLHSAFCCSAALHIRNSPWASSKSCCLHRVCTCCHFSQHPYSIARNTPTNKTRNPSAPARHSALFIRVLKSLGPKYDSAIKCLPWVVKLQSMQIEFWEAKHVGNTRFGSLFAGTCCGRTVCKYRPEFNKQTGALPSSPDWIFA